MFALFGNGFQGCAFHDSQVIEKRVPFLCIRRHSVNQRVGGCVVKPGWPAHANAPLREQVAEQPDGRLVLRPEGVIILSEFGKDVEAN